MKAEDIAELIKSATTLTEHNAIITTFQKRNKIDRTDAVSKYKKFNDEHPDYYTLSCTKWENNGQLGNIREADDETIVINLKSQRDWLLEKSILKFGEDTIKRVMQQSYTPANILHREDNPALPS